MASTRTLAERALEQGEGILRLAPAWVPRDWLVPGNRIKLHPDGRFAYGGERGGISERWMSSTTQVDNGPSTTPNEGRSFVVFEDGRTTERFLLRDTISELKGAFIGDRIWDTHARWPMYSKFFDFQCALPIHLHHREEHSNLVGEMAKAEAYYFPQQLNNHLGDFPCAFFGLKPGTTKEQVRECLMNFEIGDNRIKELSVGYTMELGTGWDTPPGILHAPGSLCTYEPQRATDDLAVYQSLSGDRFMGKELLWRNAPEDRMNDIEFLIEAIDWDLTVDPNYADRHFMRPVPVHPIEQMRAEGYIENWVCYKSKAFSAKELTVLPGSTVTIRDGAAYGMIMLQGHGTMGVWPIETPTLIRFEQTTCDEFFVSESAAKEGVRITNPSISDPLVMLKHFGPQNPDLEVRE